MDDQNVTFRYKDRKAGQMRTCTVSGHEFMRRFLQHVLPKGFHKVRYYGLWHSSRRAKRHNIRCTLLHQQAQQTPPPQPFTTANATPTSQNGATDDTSNPPCPHCGALDTRWVGTVPKNHSAKRARASP